MPADPHALSALQDEAHELRQAIVTYEDHLERTQHELAADGTAALGELAKNPNQFDVVFSDVMMPGMSGIELGQEIRRLYPDMPVVLTSGYSHVLAQNGTFGFELLHKPYSVEQLSQVLSKAALRQRRIRLVTA